MSGEELRKHALEHGFAVDDSIADYSDERMMNADEICEGAATGMLSKNEAVSKLVAIGWIEEDAREQIFIALGGDDAVVTTT